MDNFRKATEQVLKTRINILTEILHTGNTESMMLAAMQLALIGTKTSAEAMMEVFRSNEEVKEVIFNTMRYSSFREEYREEFSDLFGPEEVDAAYERTEIDPRLLQKPLSYLIMDAIEEKYQEHVDRMLS